MENSGFSIKLFVDFIKKRPVDMFLLMIALLTTIISATLFSDTLSRSEQLPESYDEQPVVLGEKNELLEKAKIYVEVSGAIEKPDLYEVTDGARLKDVLDMAGGLSDDAANEFISRNFNMAKFVGDQEKIYIPTQNDIEEGLFTEDTKILDYLVPKNNDDTSVARRSLDEGGSTSLTHQLSVSVNDASSDELDTLPGIGPTTAEKIIQNRPYSTIDELLSKKVVKQSVFEQIKDLIKL